MSDSGALWGNPSSIHEEGRAARDAVESARQSVAESIGADPSEVVFTSGGTESDAIALACLGRATGRRERAHPNRLVTSGVEHPALVPTERGQTTAEFDQHELCSVDSRGRWDVAALAAMGHADVVAFCLANHEIGTIQDVAAILTAARSHGALVHIDAVQAYGKMPVNVRDLGADTVAISAHKVYGPKGIGALWVRERIHIEPLSRGHQERGRRPGTENVAGIVGFGRAAELIGERLARAPEVEALGDRLAAGLLGIDGAEIANLDGPRLRSTVNVRFRGAPGEVVVQALDLAGFAASTGAACTSGSVEPSPVLLALGLGQDRAAEGVRLSLGADSTASEVEALLEVLPAIVERARQFA